MSFWDRMEIERVMRRDHEREQRVAAGGKAGGKAKRRPFFVYHAGKVVELSFNAHKADIYYILDELAGVPDVYAVQNDFFSRRQIKSFKKARQLYVDLDHIKHFYGLDALQVACLVLAYCNDMSIPRPSFIMSTGVGICAVWRHTEVHCSSAWSLKDYELSDWNTAIEELTSVFDRRFVVDMNAKDVSRILRLAGTTNSKSGATVHPVYINGGDDAPEVHDFSTLSLAIKLAYASTKKVTPAEIVNRLAEPPEVPGLEPIELTPEQHKFKQTWLKQKAEKKRVRAAKVTQNTDAIEPFEFSEPVAPSVQVVPLIREREQRGAREREEERSMGAAFQLVEESGDWAEVAAEQIRRVGTKSPRYAGVLSDLYRLLRHRGGKLTARCDNWLFCATVCLGHGGYHGDALKAEVLKMRGLVSLDEDEALEFMSTTMNLAANMANGVMRPRPEGHVGSWDALYHLTNAAIRDRLSITEKELQIIPFMFIHRAAAADDTLYQREKKALARGQKTRPQSRVEKALEREARNAEIRKMAADGMTVRTIAEVLSVSVGTVSNALKSFSATPSEPAATRVQVVPLIRRGAAEREESGSAEETSPPSQANCCLDGGYQTARQQDSS